MKKYPRNYHASPKEWIPHGAYLKVELKQVKRMEWQCCDCGLVHNVWYRIGENGLLEVKMTRNNKETNKNRK
jgi:hypothetical protein